jgi:hypothetical protein
MVKSPFLEGPHSRMRNVMAVTIYSRRRTALESLNPEECKTCQYNKWEFPDCHFMWEGYCKEIGYQMSSGGKLSQRVVKLEANR